MANDSIMTPTNGGGMVDRLRQALIDCQSRALAAEARAEKAIAALTDEESLRYQAEARATAAEARVAELELRLELDRVADNEALAVEVVELRARVAELERERDAERWIAERWRESAGVMHRLVSDLPTKQCDMRWAPDEARWHCRVHHVLFSGPGTVSDACPVADERAAIEKLARAEAERIRVELLPISGVKALRDLADTIRARGEEEP